MNNMPSAIKKSLSWIMTVLVIVMLLLTTVSVTPALADDETPPPVATGEPVHPTTDEPVITEEPVIPAMPAMTEQPAAEASTENAAEVAEALAQLPEDTNLIVLGENGDAMPLVTEAAAEAVAGSDPYFTVGSTTYGFTSGSSCSANVDICSTGLGTPIQAAIDYLASLDATPDDGAIYVESGTYHEDLWINGSNWFAPLHDLSLMSLTGSSSTIVQGSLAVYNLENAFTLKGFTFTDWIYLNSNGNVNVNDVVVDNSTAGAGLELHSGGNVSLDGMTARGNSGSYGAWIMANGNVDITNSTFKEATVGLGTRSTNGAISLNGVIAGGANDLDGAQVHANGNVEVTNSVFEGAALGLRASSAIGGVTLNQVTANGNNGDYGASVAANGNVEITNSTFKAALIGLDASSAIGGVSLNQVTASGNSFRGALVVTGGNIIVSKGVFDDNAMDGIYLETSNGSALISCSEFKRNGRLGISADNVGGTLTFTSVTFDGNGSGDYSYGGIPIVNSIDCNPVTPTETAPPPTQTPVPPTETPAPPAAGNSFAIQQELELPSHPIDPLYFIIAQGHDQLPSALGGSSAFGSALKLVITSEGKKISNLAITLSFPIPENLRYAKLLVRFWDGSNWVSVFGGHAMNGNFVITVARPGFYVLVSE